MGTQYETQYKDGETPDHISSWQHITMPHTAKKPNLAATSELLSSSTSKLRRKTPYKIYSALFTGNFDISESCAEIQMCKWKKGLKWPLKNPFPKGELGFHLNSNTSFMKMGYITINTPICSWRAWAVSPHSLATTDALPPVIFVSAVDQTVLSEGSVWGDRVERMEGTTGPISWGSPWRLISNDVGVLDESFGKHLPEFLLWNVFLVVDLGVGKPDILFCHSKKELENSQRPSCRLPLFFQSNRIHAWSIVIVYRVSELVVVMDNFRILEGELPIAKSSQPDKM